MAETIHTTSCTKQLADGSQRTYYYERSYTSRKSRLTEEQIKDIKLWRSRGVPKKRIMKDFNITLKKLDKILGETNVDNPINIAQNENLADTRANDIVDVLITQQNGDITNE